MVVSPDRMTDPNTGFDPLVEIGSMGVSRSGGTITDEQLADLRGEKKKQVIRQMIQNDATIGALLFTLKMLIRQVQWRIDPASSENADLEVAEFVRGAMFQDMSQSWQSFISDAVSFLPWGWSFHEIVYKVRGGDSEDPTRRSKFNDGRLGWRKWPIRSQETLYQWQFDSSGGVQAMEQSPPPDYGIKIIPIDKALLFQTESNRGNPEGYSILRNAYRAWRMKVRIENLEGIGVERDLAGIPVAEIPSAYMAQDASAGQRALYDAVKKIVTNIRNDEQAGVVMPQAYDKDGHKMFELRLLTSGGTRQFNTSDVITRYDNRILMSVMADFLMLGSAEVGSFALSSDKTELLAVALGAWLDVIANVINTYATPRLLRMNAIPIERAPMLRHEDIKVPNLGILASYVATLMNAGAINPSPELESELLKAADLPANSALASSD